MTTLADTSTFTERALAATADRFVHLARSSGRPYRVDDDLAVAWQGPRGFYTNVACVLSAEPDWNSVLARVDEVVPRPAPALVITSAMEPDLAPSGFQAIGRPPLMVRPAGPSEHTIPAELTITEVVDEAGLETFEHTLVDAYPEPLMQPYRWGEFNDARVLGGPTHFFTGYVAGRPVATAAGHVAAGVNLVEFVATMPDARGRGYGEAVTWAATSADPTLPAVLTASDLGRPVYERMGYLAVSRWSLWFRP
ncbi:MAG TPA: GNAT family N-acetyltransferase [Acidimicrobiales bacterium]|jgi:GNAT superfamily N-acetyltransferase|nr:GNAT family N-acetyltransferase [Acidimicrobiales bacterium]